MDRQKRKFQFSRKYEIFLSIEGNSQGLTWRELRNRFPRQTLAHNLKALVEEGAVKKTVESKHKRRQGRPSTRYKAKAKLALVYTCKKSGGVPFFGTLASRKSNRATRVIFIMDKKNIKRRQLPSPIRKNLAFKRIIRKPEPTRFVRLFPEEKKQADKHRAYLVHMKHRAYLEEHYPEAFEKLLKVEHEKNRRATHKELMEIVKETSGSITRTSDISQKTRAPNNLRI